MKSIPESISFIRYAATWAEKYFFLVFLNKKGNNERFVTKIKVVTFISSFIYKSFFFISVIFSVKNGHGHMQWHSNFPKKTSEKDYFDFIFFLYWILKLNAWLLPFWPKGSFMSFHLAFFPIKLSYVFDNDLILW